MVPHRQLINSATTVNCASDAAPGPGTERQRRRPRPAFDRAAIDASQCKRISLQDKSSRNRPLQIAALQARFSRLSSRLDSAELAPGHRSRGEPDLVERRRTKAKDQENLFMSATASGQSNSAGLYECPIAAGEMIKNNFNTDWGPHD